MHLSLYRDTFSKNTLVRLLKRNSHWVDHPMRFLRHNTSRAFALWKWNMESFLQYGMIEGPVLSATSWNHNPFIITPGNTKWMTYVMNSDVMEDFEFIIVDPTHRSETILDWFPTAEPYTEDVHYDVENMGTKQRLVLRGINTGLSYQKLENDLIDDADLVHQQYIELLSNKPDLQFEYKGKIYRHTDLVEPKEKVLYNVTTASEAINIWLDHIEVPRN